MNPPTHVTVREDAPPGTVILVLAAGDADAGDYAKVTYLLDPKSAQGMFKVCTDDMNTHTEMNTRHEYTQNRICYIHLIFE